MTSGFVFVKRSPKALLLPGVGKSLHAVGAMPATALTATAATTPAMSRSNLGSIVPRSAISEGIAKRVRAEENRHEAAAIAPERTIAGRSRGLGARPRWREAECEKALRTQRRRSA